MSDYLKPLPQPTPETQPFWDGTKAGELKLIGSFFAIADGQLHILDEASGAFSPAA